MSYVNPNCDGDACRGATEVRLYPLGGGANLILCMACFAHENRYRYNRAMAEFMSAPDVDRRTEAEGAAAWSAALERWRQVDWSKARPYPEVAA